MAFNNKKKNANYISAKESRAIARENRKITQEIEKKRNRKHIPEEEYVTKMKNPENCVEFDNEIGRASCGKECRSRWSPYH